MSIGLETTARAGFERSALDELRSEYANYFEAVAQHPRLLVGQELPGIGGADTEVPRDSKQAEEWQGAVKHLLTQELKSRASALADEQAGAMQTLHASIELFQKNPDLVPGTKGFDRELADELVKLIKPYELRENGKLQGYQIDVQPLAANLRAQLQARRAAAPPAPAAPAAKAAPAAPAAAPQAGIPSRAGSSGEGAEDFSALFGTLGLSGLRI